MKILRGIDRWRRWGLGFNVWQSVDGVIVDVTLWKIVAWVEFRR